MKKRSSPMWIKMLLIAIVIFFHGQCSDRAKSQNEELTVTKEHYARAESWLLHNIMPLVKNISVIPYWAGDSDQFWYKRQTREGIEFVLVDAATGSREPAFDHRSVAKALSEASGRVISEHNLPFQNFENNTGRSALIFSLDGREYRCDLSLPSCSETTKATPEGVLVSPDLKWGVFTREGNLWLRDMRSGVERSLTLDGQPNYGYGITYDGWKASFIPNKRAGRSLPPMESYWSPDSSKVIVTRIDQRHIEAYPFMESAPDDGSFRPKVHMVRLPLVGEKPAAVEWFVFDITRDSHLRLELPYDKLLAVQQDMLALRIAWFSADCEHLYAVAFGDNMESAFFFDVDLSSGAVRTVIEEHVLPRTDLNSTSYNPPNVRVVGDCAEVIWFSQRDGWGHLYLYDGQTGKLKNQITRGEWLVRDIVRIDEEKRRIFFTGGGREEGNPYYRYLYRINFDGTDLTLLSPEKADHMITSPWNDVLALDGAQGYDVVSPGGDYVVYNYSRVDQPTETVIRAVKDGTLIAAVESADAGALYAAGWRDPEEFVVKAADGETDLYGVMYNPRDLDLSKKYPVIDTQYASPLTAVAPRNFIQALRAVGYRLRAPCLAELGFVVVAIDARGTTYRSKEFLHYSYGKLHTMGFEDHIAAIRQLAERYPYIDAERVGIHGGSYGGWGAFRAMLEFPDFYKVGIANAGAGSQHNMYLDYHATAFHGRPRYSDGTELRPNPTEVPENWINIDGRQQVNNLKGKLLITLGELDENVLPGSTLQLVNALIKADKDFEMLYLPNTPHGYRMPYTIRRFWDFFVRHLLGAEPPEYHIKPWE